MHATQLGTSVQGGYGFAGIEESIGIESLFHGMKDV
jgi:hypothetical protein